MARRFHSVVLGGGAAGFFAALSCRNAHPEASVLLLEKTGALLSKVRISGGGRCNVTHACFDPRLLAQNYPRGGKELIGPFTRFQPRDTIQWFEERGVALKTEADGRIFPVNDSSSSIIDCLMREAERLQVEIRTRQKIVRIEKLEGFSIYLASGEKVEANYLCLATGSFPDGQALAKGFGHTIQDPVPSLFTFNIPSSPLKDLAGISVDPVTLTLKDSGLAQSGPLLITHWGFSGPAALKLSAWGARLLHAQNYQVALLVDWLPDWNHERLMESLRQNRRNPQTLANQNPFSLPKNLWRRLLQLSGIEENRRLSEISKEALAALSQHLKADQYPVNGKTTYKEEFVTCGGITLSEVDFKTMESRLCKGLYFAGEILDIDAVTGGFNFQNAWTTGWLAGQAMV